MAPCTDLIHGRLIEHCSDDSLHDVASCVGADTAPDESAHPLAADPAMAVGRISGIEPRRDRAEDTRARAAMDAAENKGPAVQDRDLFAPDVKSSTKVSTCTMPQLFDTFVDGQHRQRCRAFMLKGFDKDTCFRVVRHGRVTQSVATGAQTRVQISPCNCEACAHCRMQAALRFVKSPVERSQSRNAVQTVRSNC